MAKIKLRYAGDAGTVKLNSNGDDATLKYIVTESADALTTIGIASTTVPSSYLSLPFSSFSYSEKGSGVWYITANYKRELSRSSSTSGGGGGGGIGQSLGHRFSFDIGGGSQRVQRSLETLSSTPVNGQPAIETPDYQKYVNVTDDAIEGYDVEVSSYAWSETHDMPSSVITPAYKKIIKGANKHVCDATFRGFPAAEVLFLGVTGTIDSKEDFYRMTFSFLQSDNLTAIEIGSVNTIEKKGHEYLWVQFEDTLDEKSIIKKPTYVFVEKSYEEADLSKLEIGVAEI